MKRRQLFKHLSKLFGSAALLRLAPAAAASETKPVVVKTPAQWKQLLSPASYNVLFEEGTERPGSSALDAEKRKGTFVCAACNNALFDSATKYDSGTGWPSFYDGLPNALATRTDYKMVFPRTEYHCVRCGGHQGHIFKDGPKPSGLRYCNNGVALQFILAGQPLPELRT
ncbi:MAG: peptide-methionine (R)-S-oxide reductase [Janthinobacterium sp.]|jgi:peptide-methionine (R)-S-oxide reductase